MESRQHGRELVLVESDPAAVLRKGGTSVDCARAGSRERARWAGLPAGLASGRAGGCEPNAGALYSLLRPSLAAWAHCLALGAVSRRAESETRFGRAT